MNIIIIGGGAAGFFSAIHNKQNYPHATVTILEKSLHVLSKVKISGGGRCNVTHACFDPKELTAFYPRGHRELLGPFHHFNPTDTVRWFESRGVSLKTEPDNRMFPRSNSSQTIMDCLIQTAHQHGVHVRTNTHVIHIKKKEDSFIITLKDNSILTCTKLILATGSSKQGHDFAKQLGHTLIAPIPSLFTFTIKDRALRQLQGLALPNVHTWLADHPKHTQSGPLLITHWGLSGPSIIKLSAWQARTLYDANYQADLIINYLPNCTTENITRILRQMKYDHPKKELTSISPFSDIPIRFWTYLLEKLSWDPHKRWASLSDKEMMSLTSTLSEDRHLIDGKGAFKEEFVTCGGVSLKEINFKTMESKVCSGLYLIGELLDIDGVTGGFNFQNAWTTGFLSGNP